MSSQNGDSQAGGSQAGSSQAGSPSRAGARREFRPMDAIVIDRAALTEEEKQMRRALGFSENYMGDATNEKNRSADIPDDQNCSLYITGLPLDVTVRDIFDDIRNIGKVYSLHISPRRDSHSRRAAAIVFFTRAAAERFFNRFATRDNAAARWGGAVPNPGRILGRRPVNVVWNQVKVAPCTGREHVTRVLQVEGPSEIVNEEFLLAYFRTKCRFDMETFYVLWQGYLDVPQNQEGQPPAPPAPPAKPSAPPAPPAPPATASAYTAQPAPAPEKGKGRALASNNWRERAQPVAAEPEPLAQKGASAPTERRHYTIMEFRFGTVKGQALACRMSLDWEFKERGVLCRYVEKTHANIAVLDFQAKIPAVRKDFLFNAVKHSYPTNANLWAADLNKKLLDTKTFLSRQSTLASTEKSYSNMVAAKVEVETSEEMKTENGGGEDWDRDRTTCDYGKNWGSG
ncbi:hypothetical protein N0V85_002308 [Neurospora sp. IMI 360204]|nr:hypothetical protein N0V85_002308 [Neurospora sp. IMI 360204]